MVNYWPERTIDRLIQADVVRRELEKAPETVDETLVDFVVQHAKKLFTLMSAHNNDNGCHGARLLRRVIHCAPSAQDPQLDPRGPSQLAARIHTRDSLLSLRCARTKRLLYL